MKEGHANSATREGKPSRRAVVVRRFKETLPRRKLAFYPARTMWGAAIGQGCYWKNPSGAKKGH